MGDPRLGVVGYNDRWDAPEELQGPAVGPDEGAEVLARGRLHIGVAGGPQGGHEDGDRGDPAGPGVGDGHLQARVVHEHLLPSPVHLAHDHVEPAPPEPVALAELRVLVAVGVLVLVHKPEELQGHPLPAELPVDPAPVRLRATAALAGVGGRVRPEWVDDFNRNGWTISPGILIQRSFEDERRRPKPDLDSQTPF
jgi:hypothetical protein